MAFKKNPRYDLRLKYKKVIELTLALALLICILLFQAFKKLEHRGVEKEFALEKIEAEEIPQTEQEKLPPPPSRPAVPIESESEDIPDDVTIDDTEIDFEELPPPPPPPPAEDEAATFFVAYDEPPQPIGGFEAIQKKLVYPEIARKAGIEGQVTIYAHINEKGDVINTRILVPLGNSGCNEAAVAAIKAVKWKPAKQRDKPVAVWVSIPVKFKLK
jgi:protein TonB